MFRDLCINWYTWIWNRLFSWFFWDFVSKSSCVSIFNRWSVGTQSKMQISRDINAVSTRRLPIRPETWLPIRSVTWLPISLMGHKVHQFRCANDCLKGYTPRSFDKKSEKCIPIIPEKIVDIREKGAPLTSIRPLRQKIGEKRANDCLSGHRH